MISYRCDDNVEQPIIDQYRAEHQFGVIPFATLVQYLAQPRLDWLWNGDEMLLSQRSLHQQQTRQYHVML